MLASSWPEKSRPSPMASPRFTQPQHTVEIFWSMPDQYSQMIAPVFALSAKTSSLPVTTYMIPSLTSGDPSKEYLPPAPEPLRRVIQAPLSCATLVVSICFSVEYRWLVRLPPFVTQSFPAGPRTRRSMSGSAARAGWTIRNEKLSVVTTAITCCPRRRMSFSLTYGGRERASSRSGTPLRAVAPPRAIGLQSGRGREIPPPIIHVKELS